MTRSVLTFTLFPGKRNAFVAAFREADVLGHARNQAGFIRSEVCIPADSPDTVMVTAEWESPEAYQGWRDNPIRETFTPYLEPLVESMAEPQVYESVWDVRA